MKSISFARTPDVCPLTILPVANVPDDTFITALGGVATPLVSVPGTASNIPLTLNTSETPSDISLWSNAVPKNGLSECASFLLYLTARNSLNDFVFATGFVTLTVHDALITAPLSADAPTTTVLLVVPDIDKLPLGLSECAVSVGNNSSPSVIVGLPDACFKTEN